MTVGPLTTRGHTHLAVFFGDLKANAYAHRCANRRGYLDDPRRGAFCHARDRGPALYKGRLYVPISAWEGFQARVLDYPCCTAVGSVSALNANTGKRVWKTYTIAQPPQPTHKNSQGVQQWAPGRRTGMEHADHRSFASSTVHRHGRCFDLSSA